jgi:hypothetical protein
VKERIYTAAGSPGTFSRYLDSRRAPCAAELLRGDVVRLWNDPAAPLTRGVNSAGPPGGERPGWGRGRTAGGSLARGGFGSVPLSPILSLA